MLLEGEEENITNAEPTMHKNGIYYRLARVLALSHKHCDTIE